MHQITSLSSGIQIQLLRADLDAANKKADGYFQLIASLSEELDNLRKSICHTCKTKFIAAVASSSSGPLPSRIQVSGAAQIQHPNSKFGLPPHAQSSSATKTQPSTTPEDEIHPKQPRWSVSHNPKIKQSLHIDLGKTLKFTAMVFCVKFSPDGKYLAVGLGFGSGKTYLYDVEKGSNICHFVDLHLKNQPTVWCVQFSPDNKYIAATSGQLIRVWEIARKRTRVALSANSVSLCFSPNGRFLVASKGWSLCIFSLRDGSSKKLLDNHRTTFSITFSPDGRHIASEDFDCWLRIWDARTGQLLSKWYAGAQDGLCVAFSPDGKGLMNGGGDGILRYWDVSSLAHMKGGRDQVIGGIPGQRFPQIRKFEGHTSWIQAISFSLDYRWIATCSTDKTVRIWDPHTAQWQCTLHGHDAYARTVDFSPTGKYLASGGEDRQVRLWKYRP